MSVDSLPVVPLRNPVRWNRTVGLKEQGGPKMSARELRTVVNTMRAVCYDTAEMIMTFASHHEDSDITFQQARKMKELGDTLRDQFTDASLSFGHRSTALSECTPLNVDQKEIIEELTGIMNTAKADVDDALATVRGFLQSYNEAGTTT